MSIPFHKIKKGDTVTVRDDGQTNDRTGEVIFNTGPSIAVKFASGASRGYGPAHVVKWTPKETSDA